MAILDLVSRLSWDDIPLVTVARLGLLTLITYFVGQSIYRLYFHPLAKFPGPTLNAISAIPVTLGVWRGRHIYDVKAWHDKYGQIVRIGPNELVFTDPDAWKDIYTSHPGMPNFPRDPIDSRFEPVEDTDALATDMLLADEKNHGRQRRTISHAFSVDALRQQEGLTTQFVDLFISKIGEKAAANNQVVDLNSWYNYLTFDIIGEMAFGESFNCMASGAYDYWVSNMPAHMVASALEQCTRRLAGAHSRLQKLLKRLVVPTGMKDHLALSVQKVSKRLENSDSEKRDFFWFIIRQNEAGNVTRGELIANAALFIFAGSETTASLLAGMTHWLLKTPRVLDKLTKEVRTIKSADELVQDRLVKLPYLNACINEALRIFPPVPGSNLRAVPKGGAKVCGYDLPENTTVSVHSWSATHDPANFPQPDEMIPERWLEDGDGPKSQLHASQPFSLGPRGCLGKNLAFLEARLTIAKLLWNYDIEYAKDKTEWVALQKAKSILVWLIWHSQGLYVKITPRK